MRGLVACVLLAWVAMGAACWAQGPEASLRPAIRPGAADTTRSSAEGGAGVEVGESLAVLTANPRPKSRPGAVKAEPSLRPRQRPLSRPIPVAVQEGPSLPPAPDLLVLRAAPGAPLRLNAQVQKVTVRTALPKLRPAPALEDTSTVRVFFATKGTRPSLRPQDMARIVKAAEANRPAEAENVRFTRKGSICGAKSIKGSAAKPIGGKLRGCGVAQPVRVTSVQGVALSTPSTMDCGTAKALDTWVRKGLKPAFRGKGGVKKLKVAAHYSCRTRNNKKGAKISEHGKGRAIDISGIYLRNGTLVTVLKHWRSKTYGRALKKAHKAACGPFGTVLGPNADRYHQDHFHFDTARYRSGSYCR